jgi:glycosyltransferase involved in cell wall biosynthesis
MPYSLLEAVASGVAVVATAIPGQQEIATRAPGCRLVGLDAEEIAAGVRDLLVRDASRTDADAASAREWARQHVDIRPWAERLVDLYEAVAGGHAT